MLLYFAHSFQYVWAMGACDLNIAKSEHVVDGWSVAQSGRDTDQIQPKDVIQMAFLQTNQGP